jgi:hypothetical protein
MEAISVSFAWARPRRSARCWTPPPFLPLSPSSSGTTERLLRFGPEEARLVTPTPDASRAPPSPAAASRSVRSGRPRPVPPQLPLATVAGRIPIARPLAVGRCDRPPPRATPEDPRRCAAKPCPARLPSSSAPWHVGGSRDGRSCSTIRPERRLGEGGGGCCGHQSSASPATVQSQEDYCSC